MYKFNENNIVTGYIKELLYNFNLPTCQVYREGLTEVYANTHYIYNNSLILTNSDIPNNTYSLGDKYKYIQSYTFGQKILNITKRLKLDSILYDSYTHEYLGEFLRFYRDFTGVDLMMLYNCFSDRLVNNLRYHYNAETGEGFNTQDENYKIYMVPVKFNKKYLIGIDCDKPIELACGLFRDNNQITSINTDTLYNETYQKLNSVSFIRPITYSTNLSVDSDLRAFEPCLKLFIKIPTQNNSSITILEVDASSSQYIPNAEGRLPELSLPKETINLEYPTRLSLFKINDNISYPFADRLLEFLFGQAITSEEIIGENIERIQHQLLSPEQLKKNGTRLTEVGHFGVWNNNIRTTCYLAAANPKAVEEKRLINQVYDITGYVDKDIEALVTVVED